MTDAISSSQIDSMLALLRTTAAQAAPPSADSLNNVAGINSGDQDGNTSSIGSTAKVTFADALKSSLDHVNQVQTQAQQLGDQFAAGDDSVSLSDVMIATQKASIALQTTVQARNKLVSAYTDIMNMQI